MKFTASTIVAIFMATVSCVAAAPMVRREDSKGIVASTYKGSVIVNSGVPTRDFDSLSEEEKAEVLALCPAFVDGVDGDFDAACF